MKSLHRKIWMRNRLIMTSYGLHTMVGYSLIAENLRKEACNVAKILLITLPEYEIESTLVFYCRMLGFAENNITVFSQENAEQVRSDHFDVIYVSEGNTFELLQYIREGGLVEPIRKWVKGGACYIGASAGAHIAGMDVKAACPFDRNRIGMTDFTGLRLYEGVAIPHFDTDDRARYQSYIEAERSGQYAYVPTIANDEVEVISNRFLKMIKERAEDLKEDPEIGTLGGKPEVLQKLIDAVKEELIISMSEDCPGQILEIETEEGELVKIEVIKELTVGTNRYVIYKWDEDIGGSYLVPDEGGDVMMPLVGSPDEEIVRADILEYDEARKRMQRKGVRK